jgi:hypothetical protein
MGVDDRLALAPSTYVWPHVRVNMMRPFVTMPAELMPYMLAEAPISSPR